MRRKTKFFIRRIFLLTLMIALIAGVFFVVDAFINKDKDNSSNNGVPNVDSNTGKDKGDKDQNKDDDDKNDDGKDGDSTPEPVKDIDITLSAVGDIMYHESQINGAYDKETDSYDFKPYFDAIKPIIEAADIAVANFEGTTAGKEKRYQAYPLFNAPDDVLDAIKYAGFDVLSTVNNHTIDMRKDGVVRTIEKMDERGLAHVGTYVKKPDTRVLIQDVKGIKIAFLAYTEMLNGLESVMTPEDLDAMINVLDKTKIKEDIAYAKENKADLIVMFVHWGTEYMRTHNNAQKTWADFMISEGVDIILGSHPHVIQEAEHRTLDDRKAFIIYSMGNFISNQRQESLPDDPVQIEDGVILNIKIKKSGETGKTTIEDVSYTPTWVYRARQEGKSTYTYRVLPVMEYLESDEYPASIKDRMRRSYKDTMSKLGQN